MTRSKLFEYAILYHPEPKADFQGNLLKMKSEILVDLKQTLALTPEEVSILAAREIPEAYMDKLEEVEILVRPF